LGESLIWPRDRLTRFEVARLIGARALQIALGAPVLIKTEEVHPIKIARLEFKNILIPITIKRKLPSGEEIVIDIKAAIKNWLENHKEEI
jgi:DNA-directed RNA polymerase subunit K